MEVNKEKIIKNVYQMIKSDDAIINFIQNSEDNSNYRSVTQTNITMSNVTYKLKRELVYDLDRAQKYRSRGYPKGIKIDRESYYIRIHFLSKNILSNGVPRNNMIGSVNIDKEDYDKISQSITDRLPKMDDVESELKSYFRESRLGKLLDNGKEKS